MQRISQSFFECRAYQLEITTTETVMQTQMWMRRTMGEEDDDDGNVDTTKLPSTFVRSPTHPNANHAIVEVLVESALHSNETGNELLKHVLKIQKDMLVVEAESDWEDVRPIVLEIPVALSCNGAPAYSLLRRKRGRIKIGKEVLITCVASSLSDVGPTNSRIG
jgi:hypothetical protein